MRQMINTIIEIIVNKLYYLEETSLLTCKFERIYISIQKKSCRYFWFKHLKVSSNSVETKSKLFEPKNYNSSLL